MVSRRATPFQLGPLLVRFGKPIGLVLAILCTVHVLNILFSTEPASPATTAETQRFLEDGNADKPLKPPAPQEASGVLEAQFEAPGGAAMAAPAWVGTDDDPELQPAELDDSSEQEAKAPGYTPAVKALLRPRKDLVDWLENVASLQEVEAMQELKIILETNRDTVAISDKVLAQGQVQGWTYCSLEGETCECNSQKIRFGDPPTNRWVEVSSKKTVHCTPSSFSGRDPNPGNVKTCQCFHDVALCPNGKPVNKDRCPGNGDHACRAGCGPARMQPPAELRSRAMLCSGNAPMEFIWGCDPKVSRRPSATHPHAEAQQVLDVATADLCKDHLWQKDLEVYLDCEFRDQYLRWTNADSEWFEEAFVTYVAGNKGSKYEWQATNVVRSAHLFSSRPIIVTVFGNSFVPPLSWHHLPNVIVLKFHGLSNHGVSFNFNKIRSMILSRVITGIQLDTDQIVMRGIDAVFASTHREISNNYPWPMLPVHWMARDDVPGNPYKAYAYTAWKGPVTMRWGHAHPTWTYFALPFLSDLLHERFLAARSANGQSFRVWDLAKAQQQGILEVLKHPEDRVERRVDYGFWMSEDEDMLNINLWRDGAKKDWCKFDLEPGLFIERYSLEKPLYWDPTWYPDGIPVAFISSHNTKNFEATDWLLKVLELCDNYGKGVKTEKCSNSLDICRAGSGAERKARLLGGGFAARVCCCFEPRWDTPIYWSGHWYKKSRDVPMNAPSGRKTKRTCVLPM